MRVLLTVFLVSMHIVPLVEKMWKYTGGLHNNVKNIIFNPQQTKNNHILLEYLEQQLLVITKPAVVLNS